MKKLFLLTTLITVVLFSGCSKDEDTDDLLIIGKWEHVNEYEFGGKTINYQIFNADKTGSKIVEDYNSAGELNFDKEEGFTWTADKNNITITGGGKSNTAQYAIAGNELTFTYDDDGEKASITYTRVY